MLALLFGCLQRLSHSLALSGTVLCECCDEHVTLLTGGPLHNLSSALCHGLVIGRWVAQGGFAGVGVVPHTVETLPKFAGRDMMRTWNFGASADCTRAALASVGSQIERAVLVSKNVCHKTCYDQTWHRGVAQAMARGSGRTLEGLGLVHAAMDTYIRRK